MITVHVRFSKYTLQYKTRIPASSILLYICALKVSLTLKLVSCMQEKDHLESTDKEQRNTDALSSSGFSLSEFICFFLAFVVIELYFPEQRTQY